MRLFVYALNVALVFWCLRLFCTTLSASATKNILKFEAF